MNLFYRYHRFGSTSNQYFNQQQSCVLPTEHKDVFPSDFLFYFLQTIYTKYQHYVAQSSQQDEDVQGKDKCGLIDFT